MLSIILWIILGALAGWIATLVVGEDGSYGALGNIVIGILGAIIGGFLFNSLGGAGVTGFNVYSVLVATVGSIVLLLIVGVLRGRHHHVVG